MKLRLLKEKLFTEEMFKLASIAVLAALVSYILVYGYYTVGSCDDYVSDEVYYVSAAKNIGLRIFGINVIEKPYPNIPDPKGNLNLEHPPLAKYIMFLSMLILGDNSLAWRIPGVIMHALIVILVYLSTLKITRSLYPAILASVIVAFDPVIKALGLIAMLEIYVAFFLTLSFTLMVHRKFLSSYAAFGLALSSKYSALFALPAYIYISLREKCSLRKLLLGLILIFVIYSLLWLPLAMYFASEKGSLIEGISKVINEHLFAMSWHLSSKGGHSYSSPPWGWLYNEKIWPIYGKSTVHTNIYMVSLFLALPILALIFKVKTDEKVLYPYYWFLSVFLGFMLIYFLGSTTQFIFYAATYEPSISIGIMTLMFPVFDKIEEEIGKLKKWLHHGRRGPI